MFRRDGGSVAESTAQVGQVAPGLSGDAFVLVAVGTDGGHLVELAEATALVPRHGGHVVAAAQTGLQVVWDTGSWRKVKSQNSLLRTILMSVFGLKLFSIDTF